MIKFGAVWLQSNGQVLEGTFGDAKIILMPVKQNTDRSPAYEIYIKEGERKAASAPIAPRPQNFAPSFDNDLDRALSSDTPATGRANDFKIEFGKKHAGKMASHLKPGELANYVQYLEKTSAEKNEQLRGSALDFVKKAKLFLGA